MIHATETLYLRIFLFWGCFAFAHNECPLGILKDFIEEKYSWCL